MTSTASATKTCSVESCNNVHLAKGLCRRHYMLQRRTGGLEWTRAEYAPRTATAQERLEHHGWTVEQRVEGMTPCHIFKGSKDRDGYGRLKVADKLTSAHRVALEVKLGRPLAEGMSALHACDVTSCCNAEHLREGTAADNMQDAKDRGRLGRKHPLTHEQISRMVPVFHAQGLTQQQIADQMGIHVRTVGRHVRRLRSAHDLAA